MIPYLKSCDDDIDLPVDNLPFSSCFTVLPFMAIAAVVAAVVAVIAVVTIDCASPSIHS